MKTELAPDDETTRLHSSLVPHTFQQSFRITASASDVWHWLNDPHTFIDSQVPPYRVEFLPQRFEVGVHNNHHGPGLNLPAVITAMDKPNYREMQYLYGSYVLSLRCIRPTKLGFSLHAEAEGITLLTLELCSWVHPWVYRVWSIAQSIFWGLFGMGLNRQIRRHSMGRKHGDG